MSDIRKEADKIKLEGNAHFKRKEYKAALECYCQAIKKDDTNAFYYCNRAACYCAMSLDKYFHLAILDCEHAIELDPGYAKAYSRLAWICAQKKAVTKSIINYQRAINCLKDPNYQTADNERLQEYEARMSKLQHVLSNNVQQYMFMSADQCMQLFSADQMIQRNRDILVLMALGIPEEKIPAAFECSADGEKTLSVAELLRSITVMARLLAANPQIVVEHIDEVLRGKSSPNPICDAFNIQNLKQSFVDNVENQSSVTHTETVDHSLKYEALERLTSKREQFASLLSEKRDLEWKGMMGMMVWKIDRGIEKLNEMIKNNVPDDQEYGIDDDELMNDYESDIYGWPDSLAKRLMAERSMMPWDDGADSAIAEIMKW